MVSPVGHGKDHCRKWTGELGVPHRQQAAFPLIPGGGERMMIRDLQLPSSRMVAATPAPTISIIAG